MSTRKLQANIRRRTPLHEGFLKVYRYEIEVERRRGTPARLTWEIMERGHAVAVLGHDPQRDEIVLVNEFRPGALIAGDYPYRDNLVAGVIDPGESALEAAVREMQEEAGLTLHEPRLIHPGAYVSSGGTSEKITLVYGRVDTSGGGGVYGMGSEREETLAVILPARDFIARVRQGEINDLKTLLAGYWFAERHAARNFGEAAPGAETRPPESSGDDDDEEPREYSSSPCYLHEFEDLNPNPSDPDTKK